MKNVRFIFVVVFVVVGRRGEIEAFMVVGMRVECRDGPRTTRDGGSGILTAAPPRGVVRGGNDMLKLLEQVGKLS